MNTKQKILIVDDKKENLIALHRVLRPLEVEVIEAINGNQALTHTIENDFALAILDVMMPGMNGYEIAEYLRRDENTRHLPIIFLTASHHDEQNIFRGYEAGGIDYIEKPYYPEVLVGKVKVLLELDLHRKHLEEEVEERSFEIQHLNTVLRAIRNVNQLIVKEKDRKALIRSACHLLIRDRAYRHAWMCLPDPSGRPGAFAETGLGEDAGSMETFLEKGEFPFCCRQATGSQEAVLMEERSSVCLPCPLAHKAPDSCGVTIELKHQGRNFGFLVLALPPVPRNLEEELSLIREIASDMGLALSEIEQNEARMKAEQDRDRILNLSRDMICIAGTDGYFKYLNPTWEQTLGYSLKELLSRPFLDFIHPDDHRKNNQEVESLSSGRPTFDFENRYIALDKTIRHISWIAAPLKEEGLMFCIGRDITEHKLAEKALKESERKHRTFLDNLNAGVVAHGPDTNILYCNQRSLQLLGLTMDQMLGKTALDPQWNFLNKDGTVMEPDDYPINRTLKTRSVLKDYVLGIFRPDKENITWVSCNSHLVMDHGGELDHVLISFFNITERKQAEDSLIESEKKYRTLISNIMGMVYRGRSDWSIEIIGNSEIICGYSPDEFKSGEVHWIDLIHTEDKARVIDEGTRLKEKPSEMRQEYRIIAKDNSIHWVVDRKKSFFDEGLFQGIDGVVTDISEQKKVEQDHEKLQEQLTQSQKMEAIGTLAGGIAHDFNNLLTTILGNASLAMRDLDKGDPAYEEIEEIREAGERAAGLTRQLLAFSRKQILQPEVTHLNQIVNDMGKMLLRILGEDIELKTVIAKDLGLVDVDPGQMEQVIMNLVVNARDAMPVGGRLTIETANKDLGMDYFQEHGLKGQPGPYVMIAVSDSGSGIDKEIQKHIFEPFYTTKEHGKGTGLGLATVYGIIKQNNGFIWVYSEPNQGCTFKIYLPMVNGDIKTKGKEETPIEDLRGSETILIAEDDDNLRKLVCTALEKKGYQVLDAGNGENAKKINNHHEGMIDLMITDVVMPNMNGKELGEWLQPFNPQMKIIYMSGYTDNIIVHHGILNPGLNFIEKPFTPERLARKVREVLDAQ